MPKSVLLVGQGSQLARAVLSHAAGDGTIHAVPHSVDWATLDLRRFDSVVNFACDPRHMREPYHEARDFDLRAARHAARAGLHFVLLSTRRVYGPGVADPHAPYLISESRPPAPADHYGSNKLITEQAVQALLGDRCTVLRIANVFDFEPGRHTFFGIALQSLRQHNRIALDVSPFVPRDFLHVTDFAALLLRVLELCPPGLYNLGSGHGTPVGQVALWLLEGYGRGELRVTSPEFRDAFALDGGKLGSALGSAPHTFAVRPHCLAIGRRLAALQPPGDSLNP